MTRMHYAKMAVLSLMMLMGAVEINPPIAVRFQLADGILVSGHLSSWDKRGIDGTFGRRLWTELNPQDTWRLYQRVMDRASAEQWVDLGAIMLGCSGSDEKARSMAEQAFSRALRLDPTAHTLVEAARTEAASAQRQRREADQQAKAARLKTSSPEGDPWRADPWPVLTESEQKSAALAMRADAQQMAEKIGLNATPIETDRILLYTDLPRSEGAKLVLQLESLCEAAGDVLGARGSKFVGGFWGKAAVFVFAEQDKYRVAEAELFNQLVSLSCVAMCHPIGPKVFITAHADSHGGKFRWELCRAGMYGIMHNHQTPKRLPAWANDGLAEHVSSKVCRDLKLSAERREKALRFIREGGDINALLDLNYAEQTWPGPDEIGGPVGELVVDLLLREKPRQFREWIAAVKSGEAWEKALRDKMGISRASLVETVARYYQVND